MVEQRAAAQHQLTGDGGESGGGAVLSMLPSSGAAPPASGSGRLCGGGLGPRLPEYFRRMLHCSQMDFDSALAQMMQLCFDPGRAFQSAKHRKLTKNHWARDDPAFVLLLSFFIASTCLAYGIAFHLPLGLGFSAVLKFVLYEVFVTFLGLGIAITTVFWFIANRGLHARGQMHEWRPAEPLEWMYAFDIHCNAFFTVFMVCHVLQFFLLPWLLKVTFFARLLSNSLYAFAFCYYYYVTFRGYLELPFLERQEYFLYPIFVVGVVLVGSLVTPFNATSWTVNWYLASG
eukprot:TRINITY_DN62191_c0_g1_i1.p1 TRINITY_DN62191_c0_g1~~TRINITY_DN62191_c0_g1_i1.p1  ORF type:complete len:288 (+),score=96.02 TRINITY_DN62191_c0_g1_i1:163-1026(+)